MKSHLIFWLSFLLVLLTTCNGEMRIVNGAYTGVWEETTCDFDFSINGTYTLKIEGQAGSFLTGGKFITARDLVILNQDSTYIDVINIDRLVKTENGCLKDGNGTYYCKSEAKLKEAIENKY